MEPLSEVQRRLIAGRAAGLYERLKASGPRQSTARPRERPNGDAAAASDWLLWNRACSPGNPEGFVRRLRWDGLEREQVLQALSRDPEHLFAEPPEWTVWLKHFVEAASGVYARWKSGAGLAEAAYFDPKTRPPFLELTLPVVWAAREALEQEWGELLGRVGPRAREAFERQLLEEVTRYAELAFFEHFCAFRQGRASERSDSTPSTTAERYEQFVSRMLNGEMVSVFDTYPVLAKQLAELAQSWVDATGELLLRLEEDRPLLERVFLSGKPLGRLTGVETALSDRHGGGRRVAGVEFDSGLRLVYKPRDVGLEEAYNRFVEWMGQEGLDPPLKSLRVVAREGYGWVEYVAQGGFGDEEALRRYYRQSGELICLAYVLRGRDLHMENLIASSEGPLIVDTEMLIQPVVAGEELGAEREPMDWEREADSGACVETGLVCLIGFDRSGEPYDTGGLCGCGGFRSSAKRRVWRFVGTDAVDYVEEEERVPPQKNEVLGRGGSLRPQRYAEQILEGFQNAYRLLLARREELMAPDGPLSWFAGRRCRVVFRPTERYALLLHLLTRPKYQLEGTRRSIVMEALNRGLCRQGEKPLIWPMVAAERRALDRLDIPRFTMPTESTALVLDSDESIEGYFTRSGLDAVREVAAGLSSSDLEEQTGVLEETLACCVGSSFDTELVLPKSVFAQPPRELAPTYQAYATWVAEELVARRFPGGRWTAPADLRRWAKRAPFVPWDLYEGATGVGLFLAAMAAVTGQEAWREAAEATVASLEQWLEGSATEEALGQHMPIGACEGVGSLLYGLSWISRLLHNDSIAELGTRFAVWISPDGIDGDVHLDVSRGSAGAILGLLALHRVTGDEGLIERATRCGRHLLARAVSAGAGGLAWPVRGTYRLAGFAHGAAGIAYALLRLFAVTGERPLLQAAEGAYRYERSLYSPERGNWPVLRPSAEGRREVATFMTAWCHGAPGIALARALSLDALCDEQVLAEIGAGVTTTAHLSRNRSDHLCCGNLGRSAVLLSIGLRLGRSELVDTAKAVAVQVASRAHDKRHFVLPSSPFHYGIFAPGFFRGLAGVGYQFLRTAVPQRLPCVLGFEAETASAENGQGRAR